MIGVKEWEAEVGGGGDEDSGAEDGDDRFGGDRGEVRVGRGGVGEESGDVMQAAEATANVEYLVGVQVHEGLRG